MSYIVLGNIIALVASSLMVYSGFLKKKKKMVYVQTIQTALSVVSNLVLGGFSGAIVCALSCIRNFLCYKNRLKLKERIIITILAIILCLKFNNLGLIGLLPLISTVSYIWIMNTRSVIKFKKIIIFTMILWSIHDLYIKSYTGALFDFANMMANLISIYNIKLKRSKRNNYKVKTC